MSINVLRISAATAVLLLTFAGACKSDRTQVHEDAQASSVTKKPAWLEHVDMRLVRTGPAFEGNTEVFLDLLNRSEEPISIDKLDAEGAVALEHEGGALAPIHPISVGVAKPIELLPGRVKSTSLLFQAAVGVPRALRFYDKELAVSP
jgi:hypothetical protein